MSDRGDALMTAAVQDAPHPRDTAESGENEPIEQGVFLLRPQLFSRRSSCSYTESAAGWVGSSFAVIVFRARQTARRVSCGPPSEPPAA